MESSVGRRSAAVVLAVTLQRLLDDPGRVWSREEMLVLDAFRRSSAALKGASSEELADYVAALRPEQLQGVISNVKGIYHELLFAAAENADGDAVFARLPETTNHPGSDVEFVVDGEVISAVQLKAVATPEHVYEHLANYPGIDVLATEEVAATIPGVTGSGFVNAELEAEVRAVLGALPGENLPQELLEAAGASLFVGAALAARGALQAGRVEPRALKAAMGNLGVGLTTALALDVLLGGA